MARIIPAGEGTFGHWRGDTAAGSEGERGGRSERSFHAQGFGNGGGGGAVLAAVWGHGEIVAAGEGSGLSARRPGLMRLLARGRNLGENADRFRL